MGFAPPQGAGGVDLAGDFVWTGDHTFNGAVIFAGTVTSSAVILAPDGTVAAPAYSFSATGQQDVGLYRIGEDSIGVATAGVLRLTIATAAVTSTVPVGVVGYVVGTAGGAFGVGGIEAYTTAAQAQASARWPGGSGVAGRAFLAAFTGGSTNFIAIPADAAISWSVSTQASILAGADVSSVRDLLLSRKAAATLHLGAADAASPVAQTLGVQGARGGTDTDVAGATFTIRSGIGTGAGAASSLIFQTPTVGASSSTAQTMATRLTVATDAITATVPVIVGTIMLKDATNLQVRNSADSAFLGLEARALYANDGTNYLVGILESTRKSVELASGVSISWSTSATAYNSSNDLFLTRAAAADLRHGAAAANDADGVAQTIRAPAGGTVSAGTTGRAGAAFTFAAGAGSAAKAASGADGGVGGDVILQVGAGGAGDGAGNAGATGVVSIPTAVDVAASGAGTLTNAPVAGNPALFVKVKINGTEYGIPAWALA